MDRVTKFIFFVALCVLSFWLGTRVGQQFKGSQVIEQIREVICE